MSGETYICALCHGEFTDTRDAHAADAEALADFGIHDASERPDMAVLCGACYDRVMAWCNGGDDDEAA